MKCMIVEDEMPAIKILENHISHFPDLELTHVHQDAVGAMLDLQKSKIDLLFLDIQLPKISGLELLHSIGAKPAVILTTAFREYALDGYELEITDYLLKPISFERFAKAIMKVYKSRKIPLNVAEFTQEKGILSEPFIYIKHEREFVKVLLDSILYIESIKNHIKVVTQTKTLITLMGIGEIEERLPGNFIRVHRSFLVNGNQVERFTTSNLTIQGTTIPVGDLYKNSFFKWVGKNMI